MDFDYADVILVRFGEISLKSSNIRNRMINRLCKNINAVLEHRGVEGEVYNKWSRVFIEDFEDSGKVVDAVSKVPGVVSVSPCKVVNPKIEEMSSGLTDIAEEVFSGGSFGVDASRAGDKSVHSFTSQDIGREAGSAIYKSFDSVEVDLESPDQWFYVECRRNEAYLYAEKKQGPGGLPVGCEGKAVALISGGHDSPVAAYRMMCRGCEIIPVYISLGEYSSVAHEIRAKKTVEELKKFYPNGDWDLRVVDGGDAAELLMDELKNTRMVSLRRFMFKAAETVAKEEGARGIVTGESIGQKSSQTLGNLDVSSRTVDIPILRPLLTFDKDEIVEMARDIGTFNGSKIDAGCTNVAPNRPETSGDGKRVLDLEPDKLLEIAVEAGKGAVVR